MSVHISRNDDPSSSVAWASSSKKYQQLIMNRKTFYTRMKNYKAKKSSGEETEGGKKSNSKNKVNDKEQNDSLLNNVDQ